MMCPILNKSLLLAALLSIPYTVSAVSILDTTFGSAGKIMEMYSDNGAAVFNTVLVQGDDAVVGAGTARDLNSSTVITLYRYLPDGTEDSGFGTAGVVAADHVCRNTTTCGTLFDTGSETVVDAMLQPDGKIVIAQTAWSGTNGYSLDPVFGVVRFNTDGTIDSGFGYHGGFGFGGDGVYAEAVARQSDGKILVAGRRVHNPDPMKVAVTRFTATGQLDNSFGTLNGTVLTNTDTSGSGSYSGDGANDLAVQSDDKILVVGSTNDLGCGDQPDTRFTRGLLLRYDKDGTLDPTFSGDGVVKFNVAAIFDVKPWDLSSSYPCGGSILKSVDTQTDGKVVVMGRGFNAPFSFFLARFTTNGTLDTSFGYQGATAIFDDYSYTTFDHTNTEFTYNGYEYGEERMTLLADGRIVVSGFFHTGDYYQKHFLAMLFDQDGNLLRYYGDNGIIAENVDYPSDFLYGGAAALSAAAQQDGKLLLAGFASGYDTPSHAIMLRVKSSGDQDDDGIPDDQDSTPTVQNPNDCSGDHVTLEGTFAAGSEVSCRALLSITVKDGTQIQADAAVGLIAPQINVSGSFNAASGSHLHMIGEEPVEHP